MHFKIFNGCNYKHNLNWFHSCNKGKSFIEINTFNLCKSPNHQTNLVSCDKSINIIFDIEDTFTIHLFTIGWKKKKIVVLYRLKFRIHGLFPMLLTFTIESLHKRMGFININIKKNMKDSHIFQSLLDFLSLVEKFFHLPFSVFDLEPFVLIHNPTLKPLFPC